MEATRCHLPVPGLKAKYSMKHGNIDAHRARENSTFNTGILCSVLYTERAASQPTIRFFIYFHLSWHNLINGKNRQLPSRF